MKYLLYYNVNNKFVSDQVEVGGDGSKVVSVVDGVAWSNDIEKIHFNPHDKTILTHQITVNYKNTAGTAVAPSETVSVDYISGTTPEILLQAKGVENYKARKETIKVIVPGTNSVDFKYYNSNPNVPLTFNIISSGTIYWRAYNSNYTKTIQYKKNNGDWINITPSTGSSSPTSISVSVGDVVRFRGNNATYSSDTSKYNYFGGSTAKFDVEGNIMSLIDSTGFTTAITLASSYTFSFLFSNCTGLTSAEKLVLPATTLARGCYESMFNGCTSLTTAPELPATTLAQSCYSDMFQGCISLTTAPELPATTLAQSCYSDMFQGCISLTTAPELPATTLAQSCYSGMFNGCTSLTTAPELPATTLAYSCYSGMFNGCTSLTTAPELPATTLAVSCYGYMFYGCTSLTTVPTLLPATRLVDYCYWYMFYGCTSLASTPALPATILANECYYQMFYGCTSLTTAPELPATTLVNHCYRYMFRGCTSLTTAPVLPATMLVGYCYEGMFSGCTSLNYIKCLATDISASNCTTNWVTGVSSNGTFVKPASMTSWTTGANGIPSGWSEQDAQL